MSEPLERKTPQRKPEESLNEYISRLETLQDTQRVRVHPDYIGDKGELLVRPTIVYATDADGTPHPLVDSDGLFAGAQIYDEDHTFTSFAATVATQATIRPESPKIFYLYAIWLVQGATAAGRDWTVRITNGTTEMTLVGTQNVASGATVQLWPRKEADNAFYTAPPFPVSNAYYIELVDTMAAAETATVWAAYVHKSSEL
ncbi:MAG: hypothetical protein ACXAEN_19480 [Candidatus Thorarchaeota archaeon]|jgi:hypothetical protein